MASPSSSSAGSSPASPPSLPPRSWLMNASAGPSPSPSPSSSSSPSQPTTNTTTTAAAMTNVRTTNNTRKTNATASNSGHHQGRPSSLTTQLWHAVQQGDIASVMLLLANTNPSLDVNERDEHGDTPLHVASHQGYLMIALLLLQKGADVHLPNSKGGYTPLHRACWQGHVQIASLLIEQGAHVGAPDNDGYTPLHWAAWNGQLQAADFLVRHRAEVDVQDYYGFTPLYRACMDGHGEIAYLLLNHGADPDLATEDGFTALHFAAEIENDPIVRLLIQFGADVRAANRSGKKPHELCKNPGLRSILESGKAPPLPNPIASPSFQDISGNADKGTSPSPPSSSSRSSSSSEPPKLPPRGRRPQEPPPAMRNSLNRSNTSDGTTNNDSKGGNSNSNSRYSESSPPPLPSRPRPSRELPPLVAASSASMGRNQYAEIASSWQDLERAGRSSSLPTQSPLTIQNRKSLRLRIGSWTIEDVGRWLEDLGLRQYRDIFLENEIDGQSLVLLSEDDIRLLIPDEEHRSLLLHALF